MPWLRPTLALIHPRFAERFTVQRRVESLNEYGESVITPTLIPVIGVVNIAPPNELIRGTDEQHQGKTISVTTTFRLFGEVVGYQPDLIQWHNDWFVVRSVEDYLSFGPGFIEAIATSIDFVDSPSFPLTPLMGLEVGSGEWALESFGGLWRWG